MARARRAWRGPEGLQRSRIGVYRQAPGHSPGETGHELGPLPVPAQPQPQLAPVADHRIDEVLAAEPAGLEGRLPPPPEPQADADVVTEPVLPLPALEPCGFSREDFVDAVIGYRRELWLWLSGDRQWSQFVTGLAGRVARRLPVAADS